MSQVAGMGAEGETETKRMQKDDALAAVLSFAISEFSKITLPVSIKCATNIDTLNHQLMSQLVVVRIYTMSFLSQFSVFSQ